MDIEEIYVDVRVGRKEVILSLSNLGTYTAGGITADFSDWFTRQLFKGVVDSVDVHEAGYQPEIRMVDRSSVAAGIKIRIFTSGTTIYDDDGAGVGSLPIYVDEDAAKDNLQRFLSPTNDSTIQREKRQEIAAGQTLEFLTFTVTISGL